MNVLLSHTLKYVANIAATHTHTISLTQKVSLRLILECLLIRHHLPPP